MIEAVTEFTDEEFLDLINASTEVEGHLGSKPPFFSGKGTSTHLYWHGYPSED